MKLQIDGKCVVAKPGQTLLQIIKSLELDHSSFAVKPIAAKIAGEVFNLNYIPIRESSVNNDRASMRRAMAASNGIVSLLSYRDPAGRDVYYRTAQFVLFLALHELWPDVRAIMQCTVGNALYVEVRTSDFSTDAVPTNIG